MATSPIVPDQFCSLRLSATASPCEQSTALKDFLDNFCTWYSWAFKADGSLSDEFASMIGDVSGSGGGGSTTLSAPSNVAATSDRTSDVKVTWSAVSSASSYSVYRGGTSDTAAMEVIASGISGEDDGGLKSYKDEDASEGTVYYYALKAHNTLNNSGFSAVASGKKSASSGITPHTYTNTATPEEFHIPAGATSMTIELWGPGGRGGNNTHSGWIVAPNTLAFGGGGASGSYMKITGVTVVAGEVWVLDPGAPGSNTAIYKATHGSSVNAYATYGNPGGNAKSYTIPGAGGAAASSRGASALPSGTVDDAHSMVGNPGSSGTTTVAGSAGAAISADGYSAGYGTDGINSNTTQADAGGNGAIRLTFT